MDRRRFLKDSLSAVEAVTLASMLAPAYRALGKGEGAERKHLVVLGPPGASGWDLQSFLMGLNPEFMGGVETYTAFATPYSRSNWTPRNYSVEGSSARYRAHPSVPDGSTVLGPGLSSISDSMIKNWSWFTGKWNDGGHDISGSVVLNGLRSRYAIGAPSLIAKKLGDEYPRPLNYVQLGGSFANTGIVGGNGEPVVISDFNSLKQFTQPTRGDVAIDRRLAVSNLVERLANVALRSGVLKERGSIASFEGYRTSYSGVATVLGADWTTRVGPGSLLDIQSAYLDTIWAQVRAHPYWNRYLRVEPNGEGVVKSRVEALAFRFALTEFFLKEDLSAVIEFPILGFDAHGQNQRESCEILAIFTGLALFTARLQGYSIGNGKSLFDQTTIVAFSEFDRSQYIMGNVTKPGTDHGVSNTVLFAGYGVNPGKVIGRQRMGPEHPHLSSDLKSQFTSPQEPLPVNLVTGEPDINGTIPFHESAFPTLLSIFDVPIPAQQITAWGKIPGLLKRG